MGRILVVDDSSSVRMKLSKAVMALGHEVEVASDGPEAIQSIRAGRYDTVLLDIMMPGMDGFEVLETIKADQKTKDLPVIVISSLSDTMSSVVRALELGAEDFLPKNFELPLLRSRLTASVEKSERRLAPNITIRPATRGDIPLLLGLISTAGSGIPLETWRRTAMPGLTAWERGHEEMLDPASDIHFEKCWLAETQTGGLGAMVLNRFPELPAAAVHAPFDFLGPIKKLEAEAAGTAHVSYLCTVDSARGQGLATSLLRFADARHPATSITLLVASFNHVARALYRRQGFREAMRQPYVSIDGSQRGDEWILMCKP